MNRFTKVAFEAAPKVVQDSKKPVDGWPMLWSTPEGDYLKISEQDVYKRDPNGDVVLSGPAGEY